MSQSVRGIVYQSNSHGILRFCRFVKKNDKTYVSYNYIKKRQDYIGIFLNYEVKIIVFCIIFDIGLWSLAGNVWPVLRGPGGVYNVSRTRW